MDGYIYLISAVAFVGYTGCIYILGHYDGVKTEKKRAAKVRRMSKGAGR